MCFLRYAPNAKTYKLYDIIKRKIVFSKDVIFHEHVHPYQTQNPKLDYHDISLPIPSIDTTTILEN